MSIGMYFANSAATVWDGWQSQIDVDVTPPASAWTEWFTGVAKVSATASTADIKPTAVQDTTADATDNITPIIAAGSTVCTKWW